MVPQGPNWILENSPLRESIWASAGALLSVATTSYCMGGGGVEVSTKTEVSIIRASSLSLKVSRTILGYMDIFQREIVHIFLEVVMPFGTGEWQEQHTEGKTRTDGPPTFL